MDDEKFIEIYVDKIQKLCPDEKEKILWIMTLIGTTYNISNYLLEKSIEHEFLFQFPEEISYSMALLTSSLLAISTEETSGFIDLTQLKIITNEKRHETAKWIIDNLHMIIHKDDEK